MNENLVRKINNLVGHFASIFALSEITVSFSIILHPIDKGWIESGHLRAGAEDFLTLCNYNMQKKIAP